MQNQLSQLGHLPASGHYLQFERHPIPLASPGGRAGSNSRHEHDIPESPALVLDGWLSLGLLNAFGPDCSRDCDWDPEARFSGLG